MKGYEQEHLEAVADRNADLYRKDEKEFYVKMFLIGWTDTEIKQMIARIKRKAIEK
jgi:hypothetical protein